MNDATQRAAVGFDLGTTMSAAACVDRHGQPVIVPGGRDHPDGLVPSAIYFGEEVMVGRPAIEKSIENPDAFAECFKRDLGKPHFRNRIRYNHVPPEVLSAFVLEQLKRNAEAAVGKVTEAVITVPAYFDEKRRTATQQAAALAGLDVQDIINEPTAAAIALGYEALNRRQGSDKPWQTLIYDLGGGTFDVTLLTYERRTFRTLGTDGDVQLGGRDFDERLADLIAQKFLETHGLDPRADVRDAQKLWHVAQHTKHALSERQSHTDTFLHADVRIGFKITREEFEEAIDPLIERTLTTTTDVLREAGVRFQDLDEIVLVGGCSRIPLVARRMEERAGRAPRRARNPDVLVAQGAALYAAASSENSYLDADSRFKIVNVNAHSLGVRTREASTGHWINKILVPRNSPLPASGACKLKTGEDSQKSVSVRVLEGESENPEFCTALGECVIRLDSPQPKGTVIQVICQCREDGMISVTARSPNTRESAHVELRRDGFSRLDPLNVWRARLTLGGDLRDLQVEQDADAPRLGLAVPDRGDRHEIIERLDRLYAYVGASCTDEAIPAEAMPAQRLLQDLMREEQALKAIFDRLERHYDQAPGYEERFRIASRRAVTKMTWEQTTALIAHCYLVLGRVCVAKRVLSPKSDPYLGDIQKLEELLEAGA